MSIPIVDSDIFPEGGPAQRVILEGQAVGGRATPVVVVSDGRPVSGNPAIRVAYVTDGRPVAGQRPIPVIIVGGGPPSEPSLGPASAADFNTTITDDLSADGFNWAAMKGGGIVDQFGKIILYPQRYNGNDVRVYFVWSNDEAQTWEDNAGISGGEAFLIRGNIVYDAARDCIHSLLCAVNPSTGGMIYRRYTITRDVDDNITSIARVPGVSVVIDDAGGDDGNGLEFPTIFMADADTVVALWGIRTATGGEIRMAKVDLSGDDNAGGTAANWVHVGINSTTTIGVPPAVTSYTIPFTQATNAIPYFSILRQADGDIRFVIYDPSGAPTYKSRRLVSASAVSWTSLSALQSLLVLRRAGTDTGYTLKYQLISQVSEDGDGNAYVGLANWKSDADGDTWTLVKVLPDDTLDSLEDIYSAGGPHSFAPTGDAAYDATADRVVVTYEESGSDTGWIGLWDTDLAETQAPEEMDVSAQDIPCIVTTRLGGDRVLVIWRVQGSPPQIGKYATMEWE